MRGMLLVTLLGLAVVGTASSSYVAVKSVMDGGKNTCDVPDEPNGLEGLASLLHKARLTKH